VVVELVFPVLLVAVDKVTVELVVEIWLVVVFTALVVKKGSVEVL